MSPSGPRRSERIASLAPQASIQPQQAHTISRPPRSVTRKRKLSAVSQDDHEEYEDQDMEDRAALSPGRASVARMPDLQALLDNHRRMRREQSQDRRFGPADENQYEGDEMEDEEASESSDDEDADDPPVINPRVRQITPLLDLPEFVATEQRRRDDLVAAAQAERDAQTEALRVPAENPIKKDPDAGDRSHASRNDTVSDRVSIKQEDVDMDNFTYIPQSFNPELPVPSIEQDIKPPKFESELMDTDTIMSSAEDTGELAEIDAATYEPAGQLAATRNVLQAMNGVDMHSTQYDRRERSAAPVDLSEHRIANTRGRKKAVPRGGFGKGKKASGEAERSPARTSAPFGSNGGGAASMGSMRGKAASKVPSAPTRRSKRHKPDNDRHEGHDDDESMSGI